jgi:hypothetical protein
MASDTKTIKLNVRLLDEGTEVSRPTEGLDLGNGLYKILATLDYNPEDEHWEFPPGSTVRVEKRQDASGEYLLATKSE